MASKTYIDLKKDYLVSPGSVIVYDIDAILESISNILTTPYYTRLFNRGFGSKISSVLFMPVTEETASILFSNIVDALSLEPRIYVDQQNSYVRADSANNAFNAQIQFVIIFNGQVGTYNHTFLSSSQS